MLALTSPGCGKQRGKRSGPCEGACSWAGNLKARFTRVSPGTDILDSPRGGVRPLWALRSGGWQDCWGAGAGGGRVRLFSPQLSLHTAGLGTLMPFTALQHLWAVGELQWRGKNQPSAWLSMAFQFWERKCLHKAWAAARKAFQPHSLPFICLAYTLGKYTHRQQHWVLLIPHPCCLLPTPSPSTLLCTGVLHRAEQTNSPSRLCPRTASPATPACLGLACCLWATTWSLLLWPVSSPYSQATCPQSFHVLYLLDYIVLPSMLPETAWSALSLSALVIPSINHSTTTFTVINLLPVFQIKTHFSLPYVNTSNKHRLNVFHF